MGQLGHFSHGTTETMGQGRRLRGRQGSDSLHVSTHLYSKSLLLL